MTQLLDVNTEQSRGYYICVVGPGILMQKQVQGGMKVFGRRNLYEQKQPEALTEEVPILEGLYEGDGGRQLTLTGVAKSRLSAKDH